VRLTEKFITTDPISAEQRDRLIANIRTDFTRAADEIRAAGYDFVIGTSGTVLNMVAAASTTGRKPPDENLLDVESFSETVTLEQIKRLNRRLGKMKLRQRKRVAGIEKPRADIIIAGGLLLENILSDLEAEEITSCDWSLREGVILDYLKRKRELRFGSEIPRGPALVVAGAEDKLLYPVTDDSGLDVRARSVLSVARRYGYDVEHSHHVARLATQIFEDTKELHDLTEPDRKLLQHASILHDIGYHIAHNNHHRHGLYLIKNSEMPGFTGDEIAMMAAVVRYHRGSLPTKATDKRSRREHEDYYSFDRRQREKLLQLAAILQIADGLDRTHSQTVTAVKLRAIKNRLRLSIEAPTSPQVECADAQRKSDLFEKAFDTKLELVWRPVRSRRKVVPAARSARLHIVVAS